MGQETVDELRPNVNHIVPGVFSIEILVYTLRHRRTGPRAASAGRGDGGRVGIELSIAT